MTTLTYAPAAHWDSRFQRWYEAGDDLDWGTQWTAPFIGPLKKVQAQSVLDLGCGSGNDVKRLAQSGFHTIGLDYSEVGIDHAAEIAVEDSQFVVGDMSKNLPFADGAFDAVMSNVAAHMFSDTVTRGLFREIYRIVRADGLFVFHVNAVEDRVLRDKRWPSERELEPNFVLEKHGQTMRFFSEDYLRELLTGWGKVDLVLIEIENRETGEPFKRVWQGIANK